MGMDFRGFSDSRCSFFFHPHALRQEPIRTVSGAKEEFPAAPHLQLNGPHSPVIPSPGERGVRRCRTRDFQDRST